MLSKQYKCLPYIFFLVVVFDNIVLTFGINNYMLSSFIGRCLQIAEIYFLFLTFIFVKNHFSDLKNKNKFLLCFYIYCILYFLYGIYKIMFTSDTLYTRAAIASCIGFMQIGMIFFFKYESIALKFSSLWLNKILFVVIFFMLPFVNFFNWEIVFVPVCLYLLFWDCLSKKYKYLLVAMVLWCFLFNGQRAQIIRILFFLMIVFSAKTILFKKRILRTVNFAFYVFPIVMFILAALGSFNIFSDSSKLLGSDVEVAGEKLSEDTRTDLFVEAIDGAVYEKYVWYGKSPASGYYSVHFEKVKGQIGFTRLAEVFVINIFTWCGIPGLIMFMLLYMYTSFRCIGKANNKYMQMVGLAISVCWLMDWFANSNYAMGVYHTIIYFMMGISLNDNLLKMNDKEFKNYFKYNLYGITNKKCV